MAFSITADLEQLLGLITSVVTTGKGTGTFAVPTESVDGYTVDASVTLNVAKA